MSLGDSARSVVAREHPLEGTVPLVQECPGVRLETTDTAAERSGLTNDRLILIQQRVSPLDPVLRGQDRDDAPAVQGRAVSQSAAAVARRPLNVSSAVTMSRVWIRTRRRCRCATFGEANHHSSGRYRFP